MFVTQQRTKEIGIRKVMGATEANILLMINRDFIRLVLIAVIIACPIAWWAMHNWLQKFAYRTELSVIVIIAASLKQKH
jgi:putative ABC transport system permease protein